MQAPWGACRGKHGPALFHQLGASLLDRTICASAGSTALQHTYGGKLGMRVEFFAESKLILIWGSNSIGSNLHFWRIAQEAKRNGAKLICIDPVKRDGGQVPCAPAAAAGHGRSTGAGADA